MANSKNTIQNIPLASELCMNALKTEVKQFQGYNEKNTTLYGGTLSPMWDNKKELPFDKDSSYTFFNSKGVPFTLVKEDDEIHLYKGNERVDDVASKYVTKTEKLDVNDVDNAIVVAKAPDGKVLSVNKNGAFYIDNVLKTTFQSIWLDPGAIVGDCQILFFGQETALTLTFTGFRERDYGISPVWSTVFGILHEDGGIDVIQDNYRESPHGNLTDSDFHTKGLPVYSFRVENDTTFAVNFVSPAQKKVYYGYDGYWSKKVLIVGLRWGNWDLWDANDYGEYSSIPFYEDFFQPGTAHNLWHIPAQTENHGTKRLYQEVTRFAGRTIGGLFQTSPEHYSRYRTAYEYNGTGYYFPITSSDDISCPLGNYTNNSSIYYLNGNLISIGCCGRPIASCLSYTSDIVTPYNKDGVFAVSYKSGQDWYCFNQLALSSDTPLTTTIKGYLKNMVVDNRFVFLSNSQENRVIDLEHVDDGWKDCDLDWILADPVLSRLPNMVEVPNTEISYEPLSTGVVYGAGVNAGYTVNNASLVGYLPNPYIGKVFPEWGHYLYRQRWFIPNIPNNVQVYFTIGDTTQSATYTGTDIEYQGTVYPIDPNGNVVLPIPQNAEIIKGYSNNDMVKEGNTVYPLMYWNNNQKTYSYMLLSSMENVTDVFSLQGQQYAIDDENIYTINFSSGVISNVNVVAYKKNLTFLGTLPTQAVFWSDFNKTFYAFTGDRILSKMFEASDIHKILYVGQNPSSLSLWVCTDTGIYILSDTDQFRLDYISKTVEFQPKNTLLLTEGEENNEIHAISLYLNENEEGEMIPVKLQTAYYGLGNEMKAVMDCWYIRLFDKDRTEGYVKVKVNTITDVTRHTEEKTFKVNPSDYDDNNIFYLRYQPKYQECVSMQLELETNLGIYQISLGVNTTDSTAQVSKFNF